jgi:hypothetical protein
MASSGSPTRDRGRRAGASAPPTPAQRVAWPPIVKTRLKMAGIKTSKKD